jgi:hypothetical protein
MLTVTSPLPYGSEHSVRSDVKVGRTAPTRSAERRRYLVLDGFAREVFAVIVSLLAETMIRVGNEEYAITNDRTGDRLRVRHVAFLQGRAVFRFVARAANKKLRCAIFAWCVCCTAASNFRAGVLPMTDESVRVVDRFRHGQRLSPEDEAREFHGQGFSYPGGSALPLRLPQRSRSSPTLRNTPAVCRNSYSTRMCSPRLDGTLQRLVGCIALRGASKWNPLGMSLRAHCVQRAAIGRGTIVRYRYRSLADRQP